MATERTPDPRARLLTLRVALAPDAPLVTAGTIALLSGPQTGMELVGLSDDDDVPPRVDAVLYDPQRHDPRELAVLRRSPRRPPTLVAYSWSTGGDVITSAQEHGAVGLLSKELTAGELSASLRALCAGHRTRYVVQPYDVGARAQPTSRPMGLTARELEVLELVTQGLTNDEIARRLYLSINSVKTYIRTAYRKIGATRRPQAVLWGVQQGFAPVPAGASR